MAERGTPSGRGAHSPGKEFSLHLRAERRSDAREAGGRAATPLPRLRPVPSSHLPPVGQTARRSPVRSGCGPPSRLGVPETPLLPSRARRTRPHRPGLSAAAPRAADQGAGSPLSSTTTACAGRLGTPRCSESASPPRAPREPHTPGLGEASEMGALLSPHGLDAHHPTVCSPAPAVPGPRPGWARGAGTLAAATGHRWAQLCIPPEPEPLPTAPLAIRTEGQCHGSAPSTLPGQTHLSLSRRGHWRDAAARSSPLAPQPPVPRPPAPRPPTPRTAAPQLPAPRTAGA